jgi:hypothetical protein
MNTFVLLIDTHHAKAYPYPDGMKNPVSFEEKHTEHHTHNIKDGSKPYKDKFYHEVANYLNTHAKEVYILGTKLATAEFKHHLESHHHASVAKKVIGIDTIEAHATDGDVFNKSKEFFKHYKSFTPNY